MNRIIRKAILALSLIVGLSAGAVKVYEVPTTNIPVPGKVSIAVPEGYTDLSKNTYPTIYLLNGHGGDHTSWPSYINLDSLATVYNVIFICPSGLNSWYFDSPVNPKMKMESYIVKDLVPWIDKNFQTTADRSQRAITGLSMGGHGALWIAFRHSDLFGNAGSTSGGVDFLPWKDRWNIPDALGAYNTHAINWSTHTVASLVDSLIPDQINIIFDCGTEDFFYQVNANLDRDLTTRKIPHAFLTSPGAHNPAYWSKSILPQLDFFHRHFNSAK